MIRLNNLTVCYLQRPAIHHLSGEFARGSHTAIVGPNGAGKSTLLRALTGLLPSTGQIHIEGSVGYLPQLTEIDRHFPLTVAELALSGHWQRSGNMGAINHTAKQQAEDALERVGLAHLASRPIATLSGGQMQRARFARLIVQDTANMLLDEPFNSLDSRTIDILLQLLAQWHAAGKTVATVVHDLALAREHFPDSLLLAREAIAWGPSLEVLQPHNLGRAQQTISQWHDEAEWCPRP